MSKCHRAEDPLARPTERQNPELSAYGLLTDEKSSFQDDISKRKEEERKDIGDLHR
jgi:hypothetical protein